MRVQSVLGVAALLLSSGWLVGPVQAAEAGSAGARPLPPMPPVPPTVFRRPATNAVPSVPATGQRPGFATNAPSVRPAPPPSWYVGPYMDPTLIPGLVPITQYGPPVPLAPGAVPVGPRPYVPPTLENVFAYDALVKEQTLQAGATNAVFTFALTNTSKAEVTINAVRTSCGCTVAKLPAVPWRLAPGASGTFDVTVDVRGKSGILTKTVTVDSTAGYRYLTVRLSLPAPPPPQMAATDRARNLQMALTDRQAVFRQECAVCHTLQAGGKKGEALFHATCSVCHEAEHRASMVPNLRALNKPTDAEYWRTWITKGKANGLMPAWANSEGGVLTPDQIESLVEYLTGPFKTAPLASPPRTTTSTGVAPD